MQETEEPLLSRWQKKVQSCLPGCPDPEKLSWRRRARPTRKRRASWRRHGGRRWRPGRVLFKRQKNILIHRQLFVEILCKKLTLFTWNLLEWSLVFYTGRKNLWTLKAMAWVGFFFFSVIRVKRAEYKRTPIISDFCLSQILKMWKTFCFNLWLQAR